MNIPTTEHQDSIISLLVDPMVFYYANPADVDGTVDVFEINWDDGADMHRRYEIEPNGDYTVWDLTDNWEFIGAYTLMNLHVDDERVAR